MKVSTFISSILSLSLLVSLVRPFLYEIFNCKCDYYLPAFIIDIRQCGHCATCYWALEFYLTKMGYPQDNSLQLPSITELQTKWQTVMKNYEVLKAYPLTKEAGCKQDLDACEDLMKKLILVECKRLESSLNIGKPLFYHTEPDAKILEVFFSTRLVWSTNWTGYYIKSVHPNQNPYIVKCPTGFYLSSYHFTLSILLKTKNIEYFGTMMISDLLHFLPQEQKITYTCNAAAWVRLHLFRNVSQYNNNFCRQRYYTKDKTYNGYVCDTEDDPQIKEKISKGLSVFCKEAFSFTILHGKDIVDYNLDAQYEKECDLSNGCEPNSDEPQLQ